MGLVPEIPTVTTDPFFVSTQLATLDSVSGGRAGWSVIVSEQESDAEYVGPRSVPPVSDRFLEAAEHIEAVRRLWDSWEDDAEIRDASTNRFVDRERLHHIDYEGRWFSVKGPSITPRPPQGQPIIAVTIRGERRCSWRRSRRTSRLSGPARGCSTRPGDSATRSLPPRESRSRSSCWPTSRSSSLMTPVRPPIGRRSSMRWRPVTMAATAPTRRLPAPPRRLADRLIEQAGDGVHGFRLHPAVISDDLVPITRRLTEALRIRRARFREGVPTPLRARLGLDLPANRYATSPR